MTIQSNQETPWWVQKAESNGMQIFAPGVQASIREARKPIPTGLSGQDMANMKARIAAQNQTTTRNSLGNMANAMGGAANPAFALSAARMRAGAGANTAASMANVNIAETRNNQALQMQRRGQMADAAKLGLGYGGQMLDWWKSMAGNDAQMAAVNLERDKWDEWVQRNKAIAQTNSTPSVMGAGNASYRVHPYSNFQSQYR